jgi:hypothetical protein
VGPLKKRQVERVLMVIGFALIGWVSAMQVQLELFGNVMLERRVGQSLSLSASGSINLEPGDRLCVLTGEANVIYQSRRYVLNPQRPRCFVLEKPAGFWASLLRLCQDSGFCAKEAETAFSREAVGKGELTVPALSIPQDFNLPQLQLTIKNGKTLRLIDTQNREVFQQVAAPDTTFVLPVEVLKRARSVEVRNTTAAIVYAASVDWVEFGRTIQATTNRERGLELFASGQTGFAPASYSYLLNAGEVSLAKKLKEIIIEEFQGVQ